MITIKYQQTPGLLGVYSIEVFCKPDLHNRPDENQHAK